MADEELQNLVGDTAVRKAREIYYYLDRDRPVLITGKTGTGKSQLARSRKENWKFFRALMCRHKRRSFSQYFIRTYKRGIYECHKR